MNAVLFIILLLITIPAVVGVCVFLINYHEKRKIKKFYDSIQIGDAWADPFYSNDPFSKENRVLCVVAKKNDYVLYEVMWYDAETNLRVENYKKRTESLPIKSFYNTVKDYNKAIVFDK
jgi:hypothetical protein